LALVQTVTERSARWMIQGRVQAPGGEPIVFGMDARVSLTLACLFALAF
jgi:hypothetical protein